MADIFYCYCLHCWIRQIKAASGSGGGVGEQFRWLLAAGKACWESSSHDKCPDTTLPGHMVPPHPRQRVGSLPMSIKGEAAERCPKLGATARGEGGLCMIPPSWWWEPWQQAAPVTWKPHLGCVLGIIISPHIIMTPASCYQQSWGEEGSLIIGGLELTSTFGNDSTGWTWAMS